MANRFKFTLGKKIYVFVCLTVFIASFGAAMLTYVINARQIDGYYKNLTLHAAQNFATLIDADYFARLRKTLEADEFQALHAVAEENQDSDIIVDYLKEKGLWKEFEKNQAVLLSYLRSMEDIKYLYIVAMGGPEATQDMFLMADGEDLIADIGHYDERETDLYGVDASKVIPPTISNGDWGWLCSAFVPVYGKGGRLVCQIGCDVGMDDIMSARRTFLLYAVLSSVGFTILVLIGAIILLNAIAIRPLGAITKQMKNFSPASDKDYKKAGVIDLDIKSRDEIGDIYSEIRSMQIRIMDYLSDIKEITDEKEKAQNDARDKEKELGEVSREAYRDPLTNVGSKAAYVKKIAEFNELAKTPDAKFAIVMIDVNFLKSVNDAYGHSAGDNYLKGCCKMICQVYKHSPIFRIGGDEFVAMLTGEDYEARLDKMKEIKQAFEESFSHTDVEPWERYSAAFGMAEFASDDSTYEMVFKRADKAMYRYKSEFKKSHDIPDSKR